MISQSGYNFNLLREKNQASAKNIQRQLVIIDSQISNYQILAAGVTPGTEVVILHPADDGIEQITAILAHTQTEKQESFGTTFPPAPLPPCPPASCTTVHIISHGEPGSLQLGNTTLNSQNLSRYTSQLYQWRKTLGQSGNLIIYGCSVAAGSKGLSFIQQLHRILGSGIAAATTPVGNPALGGSWNLQQIYSPVPPSPHLPVSFAPPLPFSQEVLEGYPGLFLAFPITESFKNSTATNWSLGGTDPSNNGGGIAILTGDGTIDPVGDGWLRLTAPDATNDADTGYAIYNDSFSSTNGIVINFDYASYGKTLASGGDGFSFFLLDGSVANPSIGQAAGGLGYANKVATVANANPPNPPFSYNSAARTGLTSGYVGIGFDAFGSFTRRDIGTNIADLNEWYPTSINGATDSVNSPSLTAKNTVALRGNAGAGYPLLEKRQVNTVSAGATIDNVLRANPREVQITIINDFIKVEMDFGTGYQEIFTHNNLFTLNGSPPSTYKMGFSAATGGANNYHEIRNLEVQLPVDLSIIKDDGLTSVNPGAPITYTITVRNNDFNIVNGAQITDAFTGISGISWTANYNGGATGPASGTGTFNPTVNLPENATITFTVTGTVDGTAPLNSAATITLPPTGERDVNLADNQDDDPTNIAPIFTSTATTTGAQGVAYSYNITTTDPDHPTRTITAPTKPSWLNITDNNNGTATLSGTPGVANVGLHTVLLRVSDTIATNDQSFTIFINGNAPSLTGDGTLPPINEDTTNLAGDTITNLFGGLFQDSDPGDSFTGIAVVGNTANATTEGTWQYSTDGTTWSNIDTVGDGTTALALSVATQLRFVPVADYNGTPPGLGVRALDSGYTAGFTAGATRVNVNTTTNGGGTSIAGTIRNLNTTVNPVNDQPSFTANTQPPGFPSTNPPTVDEDAGTQTITGWLNFNPGGGSDEATQTGTYIVSAISNLGLFVGGTPVIDASGQLTYTPAANANGFSTFQVVVQDSGGTPGVYTSTAQTFTITVNSVNDAPTSANNTVAVTEDTPYTFGLADFPFNDIDGDTLASITISQLPGAGTLLLDGVPVTAGQVITAADIAKLTFTPAPDASGTNYANFQFTVNDGTGNSTPATMSLNVTAAVNNPPTSADKTISLNEDSTYTFLSTDFAFIDPDAGDTLTSIKITSLPTAGTGTLQLGTAVVSLDAVITFADIGNLKFTPAANANGLNYANFQFTVNDGTGDGTTPNTITLDVTPVNDKPSFTAIDPAHVSFNAGAQNIQNWAIFNFGPANELTQTALGYTVSNISYPGLFSSPPTVTANGQLTYTPAPRASGTSDFQVVVQDNGGTDNGGVDTSDLQTFTITVHPANAPVNNAPNFTGNATLTPPVAQDSTEPPSMTVSNIFGGLFNDPDAGDSLGGIAVVGNTADPVTEGSWQYSPDGINWFDIGTVGDGANALALSATSFIRFLPVPGYNGTPQPLTVRAVDNTYGGGFSGLNRVNINTSNPGGNSPIAGSTNSIATSVAAYIDGTDDDDLLDGGNGNDAITGGLGNDTLTGNDGDDAVDGGDGEDIIDGGPGDDSLSGSNDNDTISGGDNNDTVSGGNGDDSLDGGIGDDSLTGGDGNDTLIGGGGADTLLGGDGDDVYEVDLGNAAGTVISDASGNDKLVVNNGTLTLDEPPGVPVIRQDNNLVIDLNGNGVQDDDADIVIVDFFDPEDGSGSGFIEDLGNLSGTDVVNSLGGTTPPPPPPEEEPGTGVVTPATPTATANDSQASPDIVAPEMDCTAPEMDCTCPTIPPPPTVSYDVPMMDPSLAGAGDDVIFGGAGGDFLLGYTGNDYLQGNSGGDIIIGGNGSEQPIGASGDRDIIFGNPGNDILQGSEGNDIIYAGQDDDIAHGGKDDDLMYGDRGSDTLMGDLGNDVIFGGPGEPELANEDATDYIYGGAGDDFLNGNQGDDFLSGGVGNDTIYGGQNNDIARGEEGNDLLFGDKGNDTFCGGNGDDTLYGGTGSDIGIGDSGEQDKLLGGAGNDFINGNEGKDSICGGDGNDTIYGGKDNDIARGEEGNDLLFGDKGNDTFCGGNGDDTLYGGTGSDIGIGDSGEQDKLLGGAGNDLINGNEGKDSICGGDGNDTIYGGKDDDLINAGAGDDLILGDLGNDTITGGDGRDTFVLRAGAGSDIIIDFTDGVDFLGLSGGLSFADLSISGDANATLIKFGDELLATLGGVNFSLINEADFSVV